MTKREIMIRAHEIAKQMEGHYTARLAFGLRRAWKEAKEKKKKKELTVGTLLPGWGENWDGLWEAMEEYDSSYLTKKISFADRFLLVTLGEKKFNRLQDGAWRVEMHTRAEVVRETEKAIQIRIEWKEKEFDGAELDEDEDEGVSMAWLPKSQIQRDGDVVLVPQWLAKKKQIQNYGEKFSVVTKVENL